MRRFFAPTLFNLLAPGVGLVMLGRPWIGLALSASFLIAAEPAILGLISLPGSIPRTFGWAALAAAGAVWVIGQGLLAARIRFLRSPELPREIAILHRLARRALSRSDFAAAQAAIALALSIDDADATSHVLRARALSGTGRQAKARRAWLLARRLDTDGKHTEEIAQHLGPAE
ncbi:MAG TPA: hypothetical protein PLQ89_02510 [Phycisphaerae bacterium]|nr:hypothetical protein [Phycisphaerae bacterium]HOJ76195.1 hypothetical protein [Phycisphaerae bacterium]HOM53592.1 hypothetical protein [Phycisphaerae bacterium]HON68424.1 hypothetical protein [Phycisphaerae bacterium]HOQ84565.1 hypothetical protein [Phycisphaerae bacterium]